MRPLPSGFQVVSWMPLYESAVHISYLVMLRMPLASLSTLIASSEERFRMLHMKMISWAKEDSAQTTAGSSLHSSEMRAKDSRYVRQSCQSTWRRHPLRDSSSGMIATADSWQRVCSSRYTYGRHLQVTLMPPRSGLQNFRIFYNGWKP